VIAVGLAVLGALVTAVGVVWSKLDAGVVVLIAIAVVFVGFSEELMTRGVLLTPFRGRFREGWAWCLSNLCFGLMHATNIINGQAVRTTLQQVYTTFLAGTVLYLIRRRPRSGGGLRAAASVTSHAPSPHVQEARRYLIGTLPAPRVAGHRRWLCCPFRSISHVPELPLCGAPRS